MSNPFQEHIRKSLNDPVLQLALDANAERRIKARMDAYASLPEDWHVVRQRARSVRAEVIAHLDRYLEQFLDRAAENGMEVHRAANAAEAVEIVLEIARRNQVRVVAKSKTMVGEEIEINAALEAAGIKVVETDLGEYIVQIRGEHPAHIITPAVHLRRSEVGETFHEKLGIPYTEDITRLTETARAVLRRTFLEADMGISGVNFGVAESGTLCIVTNEGNGRMVTTLPRVHVALMGMERLVPTMDDLALMLSLLPRSATGQKLSVYTSLIHRPRGAGESDGPLERHLVVLDNGRGSLLGSPLEEALYCIRCGACLNACPVFREIGGHAYVSVDGEWTPYPGPIGSVISPGLFGEQKFAPLARASSLCGACKEACPVDIDLPKLLLRIRAGGKEMNAIQASAKTPPGIPSSLHWGLRVFAWAARSAGRFSLSQRLAGLVSAPLASSGWLRLPRQTGWGLSRDLPRPASRPFRARWKDLAKNIPAEEPAQGAKDHPASEAAPAPVLLPKSRKEREARFAAELTSLGGGFVHCRSEEAADYVSSFLHQRGITSLLAWDQEHLPAGILEALAGQGIQIRINYVPAEEIAGAAPPVAGITGALAGIADTGSVLLAHGAGHPACPSLVTEIHLVLLCASDLKDNLADALRLPEVRSSPAGVVITGPSRTADIEMTLTIGVHGPGEVHVFCLED